MYQYNSIDDIYFKFLISDTFLTTGMPIQTEIYSNNMKHKIKGIPGSKVCIQSSEIISHN